MRCAGEHGGRDQQGLAGQRQPDALQPDDDPQDHIAIGVQKLDEMVQREELHAAYKATRPRCNKVRNDG